MKFVKRLALNRKDPMSNRFAVEADDRIVTNSKVSLQLPSGATVNRPTGQGGMVRFNTTTKEGEIYNVDQYSSNSNAWDSPWESVKTNRQANITLQDLGRGNANNTLFGPLSYNVALDRPQNIMVYVDNVWQAPNRNYELTDGYGTTSVVNTISTTTNGGEYVLYLTTTTNILEGMTVTAGPGLLASGTTVTTVDDTGTTVTLSLPTQNVISAATPFTFGFLSGTFINFFGAVDYDMPVNTLLGFDGYTPNS